MFLDNKYTKIYFAIIDNARGGKRIRGSNDGYQNHHIIPKSMGGTNSKDNLICLTYKEHRVCHRLLINMTEGQDKQKMSYAYSWFGRSAGNYKRGKENTFARPDVVEMVRKRMKENNPMKDPAQRERMSKTNHRNRPIVTPAGHFISRAAALRHHRFKHWKILYDLMKEYPNQYYWVKQ